MSLQEAEIRFRPFDSDDYYNARIAYNNMVKLGIITPKQMDHYLDVLAEVTHD
jgi:hypothetical protein